jgi:predicted metalloprotease with PDZ domain
LYTIYLPHRFGQRPPDYFRDTLNRYLSSYLTNPPISQSQDQLKEDLRAVAFSSWYAESALVRRSCMYMILADAFTRRASVERQAGVESPIDEIVSDICARRRRGEKIQRGDWLRYLAHWVGDGDAQGLMDRMQSGDVLDLDVISTGFGGSLVVEEQRLLEFGFDRESLHSGVVTGVVAGSAAAEAGLQDGDGIVRTTRPELCETHYEAKFKVTVDRGGDEGLDIEYWPRSQEKIRVWQSRKKQV